MDSFGSIIKSLREKSGLPLRKVAAYLDIDQAILSKIERGQRKPARELVVKLAEYYKVKESDLLIEWLSDKLAYHLEDEDTALKVLQVAEEKVLYRTQNVSDNNSIFNIIKNFLQKDKRIAEAWVFGSYSRGEQNANSDIDLMVRFTNDRRISLFDFADIAYSLQELTKRKIDLVEKDCIKPFAWATAKNDLIKIYG